MRSKYTRRAKNTSFVVGQYLSIRKRYDSSAIVGMLRAWKVRADAGFDREEREAEVRERQIGEQDASSDTSLCDRLAKVWDAMSEPEITSLVDAIWVRSEARRRSKSVEG